MLTTVLADVVVGFKIKRVMSAEASTVERPVLQAAAASAADPVHRPLLRTIAKNVVFFGIAGAAILAYQTGYFANDRISRGDWMALYDFPKDRPGKTVYEAAFTPDLLARNQDAAGSWQPYNNARPDTVSIENGSLAMKYSLAWLGVYFNHQSFEPKALYRVRFEAKVDGEPAAILMRNRQLDYMRERLPTTGGEFKEFTAAYAAPAGRFDRVAVIFMPDGRGKVSGSLTIRSFRIERLEK